MEPAMSSDMPPNTTGTYRWEYPSVTPSVGSMSAPLTRLPYDDAATPDEMFGDCRAAGTALGLPSHRAATPVRVGLDAYRQQPPTMFIVHEDVAVTAANLHLHLD
jgi:hypothetical protein